MENRNAGKKKTNRECEWCGKEYFGQSLFCSNQCVEKHTERYHAEYRSLLLKEKTLKLREDVFMQELMLESKGIATCG